jgi:hypothetical protein
MSFASLIDHLKFCLIYQAFITFLVMHCGYRVSLVKYLGHRYFEAKVLRYETLQVLIEALFTFF